MKIFKTSLIVVCCLAFALSCKKEEYPVSETGSPVFYFSGTVGGNAQNLQAGINNYYMSSSFTQDANNVYNFFGTLKQNGCTSCTNSLEIQLNDHAVSSLNANVVIDTSVAPGNYFYYYGTSTSQTLYNVQFSSSFQNGVAQTYSWNFGDGGTSSLANPTHTYIAMGSYNVCLTITSTGGCTNTICSMVNLNAPGSSSCNTSIMATAVGTTVTFNDSIVGGTAPYNYFWQFGDTVASQDTSTFALTSHVYSGTGVFPVTLRVIDATFDTTFAYFNAATAGYASCVTNFRLMSVTPTTTVNGMGLSDVTIRWTDANGTVYTSNNGSAQPAGSYFTILSEEAYQNNENNQATRKLHVKFSCTLHSGTQSIQITNGEAVIAVAYH